MSKVIITDAEPSWKCGTKKLLKRREVISFGENKAE